MRGAFWLVLLALAGSAPAQEVDTAISVARPAKTTIFDEIQDTRERAAFREVWSARDPRAQCDLAVGFAERYPRSVLLKEDYEIAARASVALGDRVGGLDWAKRSLRLLPENPFLLSMVAAIAAEQGQLELAATSARDALDYLRYAEAPSPISAEAWPRVRNDLRETAYFALGRVAAVRGQNQEAEKSLLMALSLNSADYEALYVLGLARVAAHNESGAALCFAKVMSAATGPLADKARLSLREIYDRQPHPQPNSFEVYASSLHWRAPEPQVPAPKPLTARQPAAHTDEELGPASAGVGSPRVPQKKSSGDRYAGSAACRECHASQYANWQATGMAKMFRPYRAADVIGDFSGRQTVSGSARAVSEKDRRFIELRNADTGIWTRYPIDFLIGSKWQQAYATKLPSGEFLVLPIQYSRLESAWVNYWKIVDGPASERADLAHFRGAPEGAIYQHDCAPCHTSQLRFPNGSGSPETAAFVEGGVNCEMCHGPSLRHVESMRRGEREPRSPAEPPVDFAKISATQSVAICAQCHMQSALHDADAAGAVNYSEDGDQFYRTYRVHLLSDFTRKALYGDGRFRSTTFIVEAFTRSRCFREGGAACASCHNPHPAEAASNPKSLKFAADSDEMCLQCHAAMRSNLEAHTRHAAGAEASRCVSCHMPRTMDAVLFRARSHQIDEIPDAAMAERFGESESPNACLACHQDRNAEWLSSQLSAWRRR